jgi:cytochrome c oxidase cbb3-type subunit 3
MYTINRNLALAAVLILSGPVLSSVADAATPKTGDGKALYNQLCAFCHGVDGRADTPVGRILEPRPRRFADPVEMARLTDDQMHKSIKEGIPGTAMAPWGERLSEPQIGDLIDYIHTLEVKSGKGASSEQISLEVGRRIYDKECSFCHGLKGNADTDAAKVLQPPPRKFADPIEMARVDDGRLYAAIKLGKSGTAMAGWGDRLSPVEIIDVMRYIRSLERPLPADMTSDQLDVKVGAGIYKQYCTTCHGEQGNAQTALGKALVPPPRNFTDKKAMAQLTDKQMTDAIMDGKDGTAMAPWGGILNPSDIRRVIRYIRHTFQHQN